MVFPLIAVGIGVGSGLLGAYKGYKAIRDNNKAGELNDSAESIVKWFEVRMNEVRIGCEKTLTELGQRKADTLSNNVKHFLETFEQIKNVDFAHEGDLGNLNLKEFSHTTLQEMEKQVSFIVSSGLGAGTGAVAGALTAFGAYSGTMTFAAASTGTAISSLSGAAATNATLAWLGGGSLATGGLGMAGGAMTLGALAAGPALAIAGWYMGAQAEKKLNEAHSNLELAKQFAADAKTTITLTEGISNVAKLSIDILSKLRARSRRALNELKSAIEDQGVDYSSYNQDAKFIVMKNVKIMQLIKAVIDTPILDKDGNLLGDSETSLSNILNTVKQGFDGEKTFTLSK
ncbi:hypothetical protein [Avibacterium paragallinarum]|uniref:hypothetical protein n=1 Tax=Avibacterium paragallinarum TaxID=728 RepID=UPI002ED8D980